MLIEGLWARKSKFGQYSELQGQMTSNAVMVNQVEHSPTSDCVCYGMEMLSPIQLSN